MALRHETEDKCMFRRSTAVALVAMASLAVGGPAAASTREASQSVRAPSSLEQRHLLDPLIQRFQLEPPTPDIEAQVAHHADRYRAITGWLDAVRAEQARAAEAARLAAARAQQSRVQEQAAPRRSSGASPRAAVTANGTGSVNGYPCGGNLPPCYVLNRESHGTPTAENPRSTAAGLWQMLIGTSNNVARAMGRPDLVGVPASHWSGEDQTAGAAVLWAGGRGCGNWDACG